VRVIKKSEGLDAVDKNVSFNPFRWQDKYRNPENITLTAAAAGPASPAGPVIIDKTQNTAQDCPADSPGNPPDNPADRPEA
jgi:hypothetical protein